MKKAVYSTFSIFPKIPFFSDLPSYSSRTLLTSLEQPFILSMLSLALVSKITAILSSINMAIPFPGATVSHELG